MPFAFLNENAPLYIGYDGAGNFAVDKRGTQCQTDSGTQRSVDLAVGRCRE